MSPLMDGARWTLLGVTLVTFTRLAAVTSVCPEDYFECVSNSLCVPRTWTCDGKSDCVDQSDEQDCARRVMCSGHEFRCDDSQCVGNWRRCDGKRDCEDGSDETGCPLTQANSAHARCPPMHFQCGNFRCIRSHFRCDGVNDCGDFSDERDCTGLNTTCPAEWYTCTGGACIPRSWVCDGDLDCREGDEEENCQLNSTCYNQFKCRTGPCIPLLWICDTDDDCSDGSDEQNCRDNPICDSGFRCDDDAKCIPLTSKCNGEADCNDGTDEDSCAEETTSCPLNWFHCNNTNCIMANWVCDGDNDCGDGSDEADVRCSKSAICPSEYFVCDGDQRCVSDNWKCDNESDCNDGQDEMGCEAGGKLETESNRALCSLGQFACGGMQCVSLKHVCNNKTDCENGKDEENCPWKTPSTVKPSTVEVRCSGNCSDQAIALDLDSDKNCSSNCSTQTLPKPTNSPAINCSGNCSSTIRSSDTNLHMNCSGNCSTNSPPDMSRAKNCSTNCSTQSLPKPTVSPTINCSGNCSSAITNSETNHRINCSGNCLTNITGDISRTINCSVNCSTQSLPKPTVSPTTNCSGDCLSTRRNSETNLNSTQLLPKPTVIPAKNCSGNCSSTIMSSETNLHINCSGNCLTNSTRDMSRMRNNCSGDNCSEATPSDMSADIKAGGNCTGNCTDSNDVDVNVNPIVNNSGCCPGNGSCNCFPPNLTNSCSINNGGCGDLCTNSTDGVYCTCRSGYTLSANNRTCEDINECETLNICWQVCVNMKGGYTCRCYEDFTPPDPDYCQAQAPRLVFATRRGIHIYDISKNTVRTMLDGDTVKAVSVDFDYRRNRLYWSSSSEGTISVTNFTRISLVASANIGRPDGIVVDWLRDVMYWTDRVRGQIERMYLPSGERRVIVKEHLYQPRGIAIDPRPSQGFLYWTDWGDDPKIEKAQLDGSRRRTIIDNNRANLGRPLGLSIDLANRRLYWVDAVGHRISSSDLEGGHRQVLLVSAQFLARPFGIAVFGDHVYWSDRRGGNLLRVNKVKAGDDSDSDAHMMTGVVINADSPTGLRVYHPLMQPLN